MTRSKRGQYTLSFKQEAVCLVEAGQNPTPMTQTFSAVEQTMSSWMKAHPAGRLPQTANKSQSSAHQFLERRKWASLVYLVNKDH